MKFFTILALTTLSLNSFAADQIEFDPKDEKACYEAAREIGCVTGNETADRVCASNHREQLPKKCREIMGIND